MVAIAAQTCTATLLGQERRSTGYRWASQRIAGVNSAQIQQLTKPSSAPRNGGGVLPTASACRGTRAYARIATAVQPRNESMSWRGTPRADQTRRLPSIACASLLELLQTSWAAWFGLERGLPRCTVKERCGRGRATVGYEPPGAVGAARP